MGCDSALSVRVLIDAARIDGRIDELAAEIVTDASAPPVLIGILNGAAPFMMALLRAFPPGYADRVEWDFVDATSYDGERSTEDVRIERGPKIGVEDRHLLLVDGIIDTGRTVHAVLGYLHRRHPASVRVCTLLDKPSRRLLPVPIDYCGFDVEDQFVVGFGLDWRQRYRSLPDICVIEPVRAG